MINAVLDFDVVHGWPALMGCAVWIVAVCFAIGYHSEDETDE